MIFSLVSTWKYGYSKLSAPFLSYILAFFLKQNQTHETALIDSDILSKNNREVKRLSFGTVRAFVLVHFENVLDSLKHRKVRF